MGQRGLESQVCWDLIHHDDRHWKNDPLHELLSCPLKGEPSCLNLNINLSSQGPCHTSSHWILKTPDKVVRGRTLPTASSLPCSPLRPLLTPFRNPSRYSTLLSRYPTDHDALGWNRNGLLVKVVWNFGKEAQMNAECHIRFVIYCEEKLSSFLGNWGLRDGLAVYAW